MRKLSWIFGIIGILIIIFLAYTSLHYFNLSKKNFDVRIIDQNGTKYISDNNPLKNIILNNTDSNGKVNTSVIVNIGVMQFNETYIRYILSALGVSGLHKSYIGYGNPIVELQVGDEIWNCEINKGNFIINKGTNPNKDLKITMSKEEAVKAIISDNMQAYMKNSVINGNTQIEMIAGNIELGSKGYLDMYNKLK